MNIQVRLKRSVIRSAAEKGGADGVRHALDILAEASRARVPVKTGALRDSCTVSVSGCSGGVSYDMPYAVRVHEDVTAHHTQGQAKYLEGAAEDPEVCAKQMEALASALRAQL